MAKYANIEELESMGFIIMRHTCDGNGCRREVVPWDEVPTVELEAADHE